MYIYTVYYYDVVYYGGASVYPVGMYDDMEDAKARLGQYIPNYQPGMNNTVSGNGRVGWINMNTIGDLDTELVAQQPYSAINLFEE